LRRLGRPGRGLLSGRLRGTLLLLRLLLRLGLRRGIGRRLELDLRSGRRDPDGAKECGDDPQRRRAWTGRFHLARP
jgi:hypothetical protein